MPKRQSGYRITIAGFLPIDASDLASQKKAIDALTAAGTGSLADLVAVMTDADLHYKLTTRTVDEAPPEVPPKK